MRESGILLMAMDEGKLKDGQRRTDTRTGGDEFFLSALPPSLLPLLYLPLIGEEKKKEEAGKLQNLEIAQTEKTYVGLTQQRLCSTMCRDILGQFFLVDYLRKIETLRMVYETALV